MSATATNGPCPVILIRGFGGANVDDERMVAYQGFNDGTVYPHKRGENYIYEGLILRFLKSHWAFQDATNVVGYYGEEIKHVPSVIPKELEGLDPAFFHGHRVVIDPAMALHLFRTSQDPSRTLWVFRYYDLNERNFDTYGAALLRLIDFIRALSVLKSGGQPPLVNIIAHSMGGLLVRHAVQVNYARRKAEAADYINKIVTLGTPHQGISFQVVRDWLKIDAEKDLEVFNPDRQKDAKCEDSYLHFKNHFPLDRLLAIVGTNYRTYDVGTASKLNRLFSIAGEFGTNYNRSDGLVKQSYAQIPGAYRSFVHKCHGGYDSLVTSRESFEIATRFFFGNVKARLRLARAKVLRGKDIFGSSEFFFGVSIKPRHVDFELFHQSAEAENCYGPFAMDDFSDPNPAFDWAGAGRVIWEGFLDTSQIISDKSIAKKDMVLRLDIYVGERDLFGIGFSDNVVFRKQYYIRGSMDDHGKLTGIRSYTDESFAYADTGKDTGEDLQMTGDEWILPVSGTGFDGALAVSLTSVA